MDDYYLYFGIPRYCSDKGLIKRGYKELIRFFHPDMKNVPEDIALEKTQMLNKGYAILIDEVQKKIYDNDLRSYYAEKERKQSETSRKNTKKQENQKEKNSTNHTEKDGTRDTSRKRETQSGISYEILRKVGTISSSSRGWSKEVNVVSWNGRQAKYDIRDWSPDYEKMGKGITLTEQEAKNLYQLLKNIFR